MTLTEAVAVWLAGFDGALTVDDTFSSDQLLSLAAANNMYKVPEASETAFLNGSRDATVYLQLRVRPTEPSTEDPAVWLESLERWVRGKNLAGQLPVPDHGRKCIAVRIANAYRVQIETGTVYQLNLEITNYEEAEQ